MNRFSVLPLLLLSAITAAAQSTTMPVNFKNPEALLAAAEATNGLAGDDLKPWHLKADYEVFDPYGKPLATGTFEEWWAAKDKWKRSYIGTHYTGTEYHLPEGMAHEPEDWRPAPWPESLIATELLSPVPPVKKEPPHLAISNLPDSKPPLSCLVPAEPGFPFPTFGTYCFEPGTAVLRLSHVEYLDSVFSKLGKFQERAVGIESEIDCDQHSVIKIHLKALATFTSASPDLFKPSTLVTQRAPIMDGNSIAHVPSGVLAGKKISGSNPSYPPGSKLSGDQGVVILSAKIDKQGSIANLQVLESPSPGLTESAMKTVNTWKYQPYLLDGKPVEVETTINVVFNLGR